MCLGMSLEIDAEEWELSVEDTTGAPDRNSTCTGVLVPYVLFGTRTVCHLWSSLYWMGYWTGSISIYPSLIRSSTGCTGTIYSCMDNMLELYLA